MYRVIFILLVAMISFFQLTGCGGGEGIGEGEEKVEVEVGYQPPVVPVRVSVNSAGKIKLGLSGALVTPIGTFDLDVGTNVHSLRNQYNDKVLIVRIDDQVTVYELEEGKDFKVNFDDDNTLYRKVNLTYESDGDIILELESVQQVENPPISPGSTDPTLPDPEKFIRDYFYNVTHQRDYEYTWMLMTNAFRQRNSEGDYREYVKFWDSVDRVDIDSLKFYESKSTSIKCSFLMTLYIGGKKYPNQVKFHLIYDENRQTWIFD